MLQSPLVLSRPSARAAVPISLCFTQDLLGEIHLRAASLHSLFRKMLSQQKWCHVDSWRWNKLVGLVVVGVESPVVKVAGCTPRLSPPAGPVRGDAGKGECLGGITLTL